MLFSFPTCKGFRHMINFFRFRPPWLRHPKSSEGTKLKYRPHHISSVSLPRHEAILTNSRTGSVIQDHLPNNDDEAAQSRHHKDTKKYYKHDHFSRFSYNISGWHPKTCQLETLCQTPYETLVSQRRQKPCRLPAKPGHDFHGPGSNCCHCPTTTVDSGLEARKY